MTLNKCFTQTFDGILKDRGFKRKGMLFYRVHGEILQGIKLKPINPYDIMITYHPYWTHRLMYPLEFHRNLPKGYWAEFGEWVSGQYYVKDAPDQNLQDMQICLETVCDKVLPVLERVNNTESYLEEALNSYQRSVDRLYRNLHDDTPKIYERSSSEVCYHQTVGQYALLYRALQDGSFAYADDFWQRYLEVLDREMQYHVQQLAQDGKDISAAMEEKKQKHLQNLFSVWLEKRKLGDINWIAAVYETESAQMRQELWNDLKLQLD